MMMKRISQLRLRSAAAFLLGPALLVTQACEAPTRAEYDYECPEELSLDTKQFVGLTASELDERLLGKRLDALEVVLERTADCDGRATVIGFTDSKASHVVLFDGEFHLEGATEIARDLKLPDRIDEAMTEIRDGIDESIGRLPSAASDVNAAFELAEDYATTIDPTTTRFEVYLYTDGITTVEPGSVNLPDLTEKQAREIADAATATDLSHVAEVTVQGVGMVADDVQPPSDFVKVVDAYVDRLCERSGAQSCTTRTAMFGQ